MFSKCDYRSLYAENIRQSEIQWKNDVGKVHFF